MTEKTTNKRAICRQLGIPEYMAFESYLERESKTYGRAAKVAALKRVFEKGEDAVHFAIESEKDNLKKVGLI